jgi:hypothetical protein
MYGENNESAISKYMNEPCYEQTLYYNWYELDYTILLYLLRINCRYSNQFLNNIVLLCDVTEID